MKKTLKILKIRHLKLEVSVRIKKKLRLIVVKLEASKTIEPKHSYDNFLYNSHFIRQDRDFHGGAAAAAPAVAVAAVYFSLPSQQRQFIFYFRSRRGSGRCSAAMDISAPGLVKKQRTVYGIDY